jgi:hypothetical protein
MTFKNAYTKLTSFDRVARPMVGSSPLGAEGNVEGKTLVIQLDWMMIQLLCIPSGYIWLFNSYLT